MYKSLQFVTCTSTCMLDPKIRNVANAIYFLAQCVPYTLVHQSQFSDNSLQYKQGCGPKLRLQNSRFQIKTFKKLPSTMFKCLAYSDCWIKVKL